MSVRQPVRARPGPSRREGCGEPRGPVRRRPRTDSPGRNRREVEGNESAWCRETSRPVGAREGWWKPRATPPLAPPELGRRSEEADTEGVYAGGGVDQSCGNNEPWRICFSSVSQRHLCGTPPHPHPDRQQPRQTTNQEGQSPTSVYGN